MKCKCSKLSIRVSGYREDKYFRDFLEIESANEGWRTILKCPECKQLWLVDNFDKLHSLFGYKIDAIDLPNENYFLELHKKELLKLKGGYSNEECKIAGCNNRSLNELAYCPDCTIKKFGIYE